MPNEKLDSILNKKNALFIFNVLIILFTCIFTNKKIVVLEIIFLTCSFSLFEKIKKKEKIEIEELICNHLDTVSNFAENTIPNFPIPFVIVDLFGKILWYNKLFLNITKKDSLYNTPLEDTFPNVDFTSIVSKLEKKTGEQHKSSSNDIESVCVNNSCYEIIYQFVKSNSLEVKNNVILYLIDKTLENELQKKICEKSISICVLMLDDIDEVLKNIENEEYANIVSKIEQILNSWVGEYNGIIRKYEKDKFLILFQDVQFEKIIKNKFEILDTVRNIENSNGLPITLSLGIGRSGSLTENSKFANLALDMALGRGGDQAVIKDNETFQFFGAKTKEIEKRTKVKIRIFSHALQELIRQSENVLIMGHKSGDLDSFGASIGLLKIVRNQNKAGFILATNVSVPVKNIINKFKYEDKYSILESNKKLIEILNENTLIIVVDTNRASLVENPELLKNYKVIFIDHHRKSEDFIHNAILSYHEPFASSSCEIITEIFEYTKPEIKLTCLEAEILYAGIIMDTKDFTFKTGIRTFEAAAYLKNKGVDVCSVKQMFKVSAEFLMKKNQIVNDAEIFNDIAISSANYNFEEIQILAAKAADSLLEIEGIEASFVLVSQKNSVVISARSLGNINVQLILEKIGGGGHMMLAAAQITNKTLEDVTLELKKVIQEIISIKFNEIQ